MFQTSAVSEKVHTSVNKHRMLLSASIVLIVRVILLCWLALVAGGSLAHPSETVMRSYVYPVLTGADTREPTVKTVTGSGSGVLIARDYILTAAHVVRTERQVYVHTRAGVQRAVVVKRDHIADLALLRLRLDCPCGAIGSQVPVVDTTIYTVGFPFYTMYSTQILSEGRMQGLYNEYMVTTSLTGQGGSGGGIFALEGGSYKLVGITVAMGSAAIGPKMLGIKQELNWIVFGVPLPTIQSFLRGAINQ